MHAKINAGWSVKTDKDSRNSLLKQVSEHKAIEKIEKTREDYSPTEACVLSFDLEALIKDIYSNLSHKQEKPRLVKIIRKLLELEHGQNQETKDPLFTKEF